MATEARHRDVDKLQGYRFATRKLYAAYPPRTRLQANYGGPRGLRLGCATPRLQRIAGSKAASGKPACLLCVLCFVRQRFLRRDDLSSGGFLPSVCVIESGYVQE